MRRPKLTFLLIGLVFCFGAFSVPPIHGEMLPEDVNILVMIGYAFGWSYFEIVDILESWGCNVTTTGETPTVESCLNKAPRPVDVDILFSEITNETLQQFHCLIVPSGGHWQFLRNCEIALDIIESAYNQGLILSGICTGVIPIAVTNVTEGHYVCGHNIAYSYIRDSGATMLPLIRVATDGQFITGDNGGGVPSGYLTAPHYELALAIMKEVGELSYFQGITVVPKGVGGDVVQRITVTTSGPITVFGDVTTPEIEQVTARIFAVGNDTPREEVDLETIDANITFTGDVSGLEPGSYSVDLDIMDANRSLEVVRDAATFEATAPTTTHTSADLLSIEVMVLAGGGIVAVVLIGVIVKKR